MTNFYFDHFFYKSLENTNDTAKKIYYSKKSKNVALLTLLQKSGRGRKINSSPIKKIALKYNIPIYQPESLKDPIFLDKLNCS